MHVKRRTSALLKKKSERERSTNACGYSGPFGTTRTLQKKKRTSALKKRERERPTNACGYSGPFDTTPLPPRSPPAPAPPSASASPLPAAEGGGCHAIAAGGAVHSGTQHRQVLSFLALLVLVQKYKY